MSESFRRCLSISLSFLSVCLFDRLSFCPCLFVTSVWFPLFLGATKHLVLADSVGWSIIRVTHLFDNPHVAPYWPTWPCFVIHHIGLFTIAWRIVRHSPKPVCVVSTDWFTCSGCLVNLPESRLVAIHRFSRSYLNVSGIAKKEKNCKLQSYFSQLENVTDNSFSLLSSVKAHLLKKSVSFYQPTIMPFLPCVQMW